MGKICYNWHIMRIGSVYKIGLICIVCKIDCPDLENWYTATLPSSQMHHTPSLVNYIPLFSTSDSLNWSLAPSLTSQIILIYRFLFSSSSQMYLFDFHCRSTVLSNQKLAMLGRQNNYIGLKLFKLFTLRSYGLCHAGTPKMDRP